MTTATVRGAVVPTASDRRLAWMAADGSEDAFAAIFERYRCALHRYCESIVGNEHDAADALQNTMLRALVALPGDTREITLRPWLFHVAHNESISLLRMRRPECDLEHIAELGDDRVQAGCETRERMRDLTTDLSVLTDQQRRALLMRELGGIGFADVAVTLGISVAAAKQSAYDARRALTALADGRSMDCQSVRHALADGDQRLLRGLRIRGHLRSCASCHDYSAATRRPTALAGAFGWLPVAGPAALVRQMLFGTREIVAGATAGAASIISWATIAAVSAVVVSGGGLVALDGRSGARAPQPSTPSAIAPRDAQPRAAASQLVAADSWPGARRPVPSVSGGTATPAPRAAAQPSRSGGESAAQAGGSVSASRSHPVADVRGRAAPRADPPDAGRHRRGARGRRHAGNDRSPGGRHRASTVRRRVTTQKAAHARPLGVVAGHGRRKRAPDARPSTERAGGALHAPARGSHPTGAGVHDTGPRPGPRPVDESAAPPSPSSGAAPADRPAAFQQNHGQPSRSPADIRDAGGATHNGATER